MSDESCSYGFDEKDFVQDFLNLGMDLEVIKKTQGKQAHKFVQVEF